MCIFVHGQNHVYKFIWFSFLLKGIPIGIAVYDWYLSYSNQYKDSQVASLLKANNVVKQAWISDDDENRSNAFKGGQISQMHYISKKKQQLCTVSLSSFHNWIFPLIFQLGSQWLLLGVNGGRFKFQGVTPCPTAIHVHAITVFTYKTV